MQVKEESEKVGLKLNIQKTKIMASGPITSWEIDGETAEMKVDSKEKERGRYGMSEVCKVIDCICDLFLFAWCPLWGAPKSLQMVIAVMKSKEM